MIVDKIMFSKLKIFTINNAAIFVNDTGLVGK